MTTRTSTTPATVVAATASTALVGLAWASGHAWLAPGWTEGVLSCTAMLAGTVALAASASRIASGRSGRVCHDPASLRKAWGGRLLPNGRAAVSLAPSDMAPVPAACDGPMDPAPGQDDPCLREALDLCQDGLARDLGPLAGPPSTWPAHARQVAAVILSYRGKRAGASALARDVTASHRDPAAHRDGEVASRVDAVLMDQAAELASHMERHAYVSTVLMSVLQATRSRHGVIPTDAFGWLADVDASLWHALDAVGRRTCALEGAAAACHRAMECRAGRAMPRPALEGLARRIVDLSAKATADGMTGTLRA